MRVTKIIKRCRIYNEINGPYLDESSRLGEEEIVLDNIFQFRKMPTVPFSHTHRESVDIFIHLVQQRDGLNDHVVCSSRIKLDLSTNKN